MEIDIKEYLSEEEIKGIVISKFKSSIIFDKEKDIERIISNTAYNLIYDKVDEVFGQDVKNILAIKVKEQIENFTQFNIFKKPDAWDRETNSAYDFLQSCVENERDTIKNLVKSNLPTETLKLLKDTMEDIIKDSIQEFYREL